MRITFILPTVSLSGGIKVVVIYAQALARMGHLIKIISPPPQTVPVRQKLKSWILGNGRRSDPPSQMSHLDGSGLDHYVLDRWRPVTDLDVPDGDIVIATWWETAEWVNTLSADKGAKVYFVQHHEIFPYLPVDRCKATYRMPLHKIVVARWLQEVMRTQYGDQTVDLVPNSVDRAQFFAQERDKQRTPTVGVLYSSAPSKGLDVSLSVLEIVRKAFPDLRIIVFGSKQPTNELALPENAEFFFCPPQEQIRDLYSQCDVWLTASRSEGFNLPAMEAMACRTPVVSTRTGWPEEVVKSGMNGVLADVDDQAGLSKGVQWVLSRNNAEWRTLSSNAYSTVAESSWIESAEMFERALNNACERSARGEISGKCAWADVDTRATAVKCKVNDICEPIS
jgi:glycosyltransferase involved in cell wall biosynthesis